MAEENTDASAAFTIPFATLPPNVYTRGPRHRLVFDRIIIPRFTTTTTENGKTAEHGRQHNYPFLRRSNRRRVADTQVQQ